MKRDRTYLYWGLTAFAVICGVLLFYDLVFQGSTIAYYVNKLNGILAPVLYGAVIAYILTPVVNAIERGLFGPGKGLELRKKLPRLQKSGLPRAMSILLTWTLVVLVFYFLLNALLPELGRSIMQLANNDQGYYNTVYGWIQKLLTEDSAFRTWLLELFNDYYQDALDWVKNDLLPQAQQALGTITGAITAITGRVISFANVIMDLLVGIIVSIYLLANKEGFSATACKLLYSIFSPERSAWLIRGVKKGNQIFSSFFRGKLLDSLIIGILCFIFSSLFKFPYAPLVSVVVGITNIIPFFGPFLGAIPSAFLILLDDPIKCLWFLVFILALQQFDGNILGPMILGESTGLSSFWVIVAILVGGGLWGVVGMFLGVPLFACLYTALGTYSTWRLRQKGLPVNSRNYTTHAPVPDPPKKEAKEPKPPSKK